MSGLKAEPEVLVDLEAKASALAKQLFEVPDDVAEAFGAELAQAMATEWGGQSIYFPTGLIYKVASLHQAVWDAFNGTNHNDLVRQFKLSRVWVYKIVQRMRAADQAKRQPDMFQESGDAG